MPLRKQIGEIFREIASVKEKSPKVTRARRVEILRMNESTTLLVLLKQGLDPRLKYALPEGAPPFVPQNNVPVGLTPTDLYHETRKLFYLLEPSCGGHPNLNPRKREQIFIQMLEGLHTLDADALLAVKDKDLKKYGIDEALVNEAFPPLLSAPVPEGPTVVA
jgi:hypothetical protein